MTREFSVDVPTSQLMHILGRNVAEVMHGGDVVVLSGPLGAGKTTFTQGVGIGLRIKEPVVSPTFTIARELQGQFSDGNRAHLVHVDAYRLPGSDNDDVMYEAMSAGDQSQQYAHNAANRLLDELESLGLDEVLEDPDDNTVILIEWGSMMASVLADNRLEIDIDRSLTDNSLTQSDELTSDGMRRVILRPIGNSWEKRVEKLMEEYSHYVHD